MLTPHQAYTRVQRGVKLLDSINRGWAQQVVLEKFKLSSPTMCVLGQVYKEFNHGLMELAKEGLYKTLQQSPFGKLKYQEGGSIHDVIIDDVPSIDGGYYGFDISDDSTDDNAEYEALGQEWVHIISRRQAASRRRSAAKKGK